MDWVVFASHLAIYVVGVLSGALALLFVFVRGLGKAFEDRKKREGEDERHIP
jgi:hypothetical protein